MSDNSSSLSTKETREEESRQSLHSLSESLFNLCSLETLETNTHFQKIIENTSVQFKECQFPDNEYHKKGIVDICFWISLCFPYASLEHLQLFASLLAYLSVVDDACDQEKDCTGELRDELESHIELLATLYPSIPITDKNRTTITSQPETLLLSPTTDATLALHITTPADSPCDYCALTSPNADSTNTDPVTTSPIQASAEVVTASSVLSSTILHHSSSAIGASRSRTKQHSTVTSTFNPSLELGKKVLLQCYSELTSSVCQSSRTSFEIDHFENVRSIMMETFENNVWMAKLWVKDSSPSVREYLKMRESDSLAKVLMYFGFLIAVGRNEENTRMDQVVVASTISNMFDDLRKSEFYNDAVKACILVNDVCSYPKDLKCGIKNNYISLWMKEHEGSNLEDSVMNCLSELVKCMECMNRQLEELSSKKDEEEFLMYDIYKNFQSVAVGYMGWCLKSPRFKHENHPLPSLQKKPKIILTNKEQLVDETTPIITTPSFSPVTYLDVIRHEKRKKQLLHPHSFITIEIRDDSLSDGKVTTLSTNNNYCSDDEVFESIPEVAFQQQSSQHSHTSVSTIPIDEIVSIELIKRKEHEVVNVTDLRKSELVYNHVLNGVPLLMMVFHYFGVLSWWQVFLVQQYCTILWTLSLHTVLHACAKFDVVSEVLIGLGTFGQFFTLSIAKYGHKTHHMFTETEKDVDFVFFSTQNVLLLLIKCMFFPEYYSIIYASHLVSKLQAIENNILQSTEFKQFVRFVVIMTVKIFVFIVLTVMFTTSYVVVILSSRFASSYVLAIFTQLIHKFDMVKFVNKINNILPQCMHLDRLLNLLFGSNIQVVKYHAIHHEFPWISPTSYYPYLMNCELELKANRNNNHSQNSTSSNSSTSTAPVNYSINTDNAV